MKYHLPLLPGPNVNQDSRHYHDNDGCLNINSQLYFFCGRRKTTSKTTTVTNIINIIPRSVMRSHWVLFAGLVVVVVVFGDITENRVKWLTGTVMVWAMVSTYTTRYCIPLVSSSIVEGKNQTCFRNSCRDISRVVFYCNMHRCAKGSAVGPNS